MNTKQASITFVWLLGLIALAITAISPNIALGYNQIAFTVVPALKAVCVYAVWTVVMDKVQILTTCRACGGQAYLPTNEVMASADGRTYIRHVPCTACEGSGQYYGRDRDTHRREYYAGAESESSVHKGW